MKNATIVNIIGIALEIVGVAILSRFELKAHILAEAENLVRPTVLVEIYQAATQAKEYEPSTQEQEVQARRSVPALSATGFRVALFFMAIGMVCQLAAACLGD